MRQEKVKLTALIFVGPMLAPQSAGDSHLYAKDFSHRFRKGEPGT
jgi:precorrin-4 methylase